MNNARNYIEDVLEEFRIAGGKPSWIGLAKNVWDQFQVECKEMHRYGEDAGGVVIKFLGLDIIPMAGPLMPADGVYIHDANKPNAPHPFEGR